MKPLFTPEATAALGRTMRRSPLLAFDFDGTLAPIVPVPGDARIPAAVVRPLRKLAERWPVAIISGRARSDIRRRLPFEPWRIVGSHGAEFGETTRVDEARIALDAARLRLQDSAEALQRHGVWIEDKGASIALHYRLAADRPAAAQAVSRALSKLPAGLTVFGGKLVVNVVPAWAYDKGEALAELARERGNPAALFVGDDVNDESVFERAGADWFTVRIGQGDAHSAAEYLLGSTADLPRLLELMLQLGSPSDPSRTSLGLAA